MNPGWYPDPFARGWLRWWDGTSWTSNQAPVGAPTNYGVLPVSPTQDIERENTWARWGRIAFVLIGVFATVGVLVIAPLAGHALRQSYDDCRQAVQVDQTCSTFGNNGSWVLNVISLPALLPQLLMMTWLYQVASVASRLGLPARRSPGWAFGFLVPVANFWIPYQVARDCFPPGHPYQGAVGWWWAFTLLNTVGAIPVLILAAISGTAASLVLAVPLAVLPVVSAVLGFRLVARIREVHLELLSRYAA